MKSVCKADLIPLRQPETPPSVTRLRRKMVTVEGQTATIDASDDPDGLKCLGGSTLPEFNSVLLNEVLVAMGERWTKSGTLKDSILAAGAALSAFKPADEIEGMFVGQAVALHFGAMECFRRAIIPEQPSDVASKLRKDGANLSRAMAEMVDALARKRGKAPQVVRVERVVVHDGGQAIVGNITPDAKGG